MIQARAISAPASEPLTLRDCYLHLKFPEVDESDGHPEDALLAMYISAARAYCENFTGLSLAVRDYEVVLTAFPATIELPYPPFVELLGGVTFTDDVSDNAIDADSYTVDDFSGDFAVISPVAGWPEVPAGNKIRIRYSAGHGDESAASSEVPIAIKQAMFLLVGHWYANREAVVVGETPATLPMAVESLLRPYRVLLGMA